MRYRFKNCVRATATSAVTAQIWRKSLDERLVDYDQGVDLDGYVWGVRWQLLYPGMRLVEDSTEAVRWTSDLDLQFHEALIETNGHNISLVFSDLSVRVVDVGYAPFVCFLMRVRTSRSPCLSGDLGPPLSHDPLARRGLSLFLDRHGQANRSSNSALAGHRLSRSNAVPKLTLRQVSAAPLPCQNRRLTSVTDSRSGSTLA